MLHPDFKLIFSLFALTVVDLSHATQVFEIQAHQAAELHIDTSLGHHFGLNYIQTDSILVFKNGAPLHFLDSADCRTAWSWKPSDSNPNKDLQRPTLIQRWQSGTWHSEDWGRWSTQLELNTQMDFQQSRWWNQRNSYGIKASTWVKSNIWVGAEYQTLSEFGNWRVIKHDLDSQVLSQSMWSLSVGLPYLKYTMRTNSHSTPDFFWLEPNADQIASPYDAYDKGVVLANAAGANPMWGDNMSHILEAKLGYLRGVYWSDGEAYTQPILQLFAENLPMGQSNWWMGLTQTKNLRSLGLGLDLLVYQKNPFTLFGEVWKPQIRCQLDTWWRTPNNMRIQVKASLTLPDLWGNLYQRGLF